MSEAMEFAQSIARMLQLATVPVLAIAVVASFLRRDRAPRLPSFVVIGCAAFTLAVAAVGVVAGLRAGIPWTVPWASVAALVLVALLLRRDERFWVGFSLLLVAYCVVGVVSVLGFSHNYDAESGGWRGVRLLVAWAGPEANPQAPNFALAATYLSIVRYGIPLAVTVSVAWVLATRRRMGRLERLSLILVSGTFLAEVVVGATLSAITFAVGLVSGLPLGLGIAGLVASLFMLLTVGPGAVTGIVLGVRWLATARDVGSVGGLVTTLRDAGAAAGSADVAPSEPAEAVLRSLGGFLRGNVGFVQRLNVGLIALAFFVLGGLTLSFRVFSGDPNRVEVLYQHVEAEQPIPGRVLRSLDGAGPTMWLVTRDERLLHVDLTTERLTSIDVPVLDAFQLGDGVVGVTAEKTPRVALFSASAPGSAAIAPVLTLAPGSKPSLAVLGTTAYVTERGGRMVSLSASGKVVRDTKVGPLTGVLAQRPVGGRPGALWTLHPSTKVKGANYLAIRRDPTTLAALGQEPVTGTQDALFWKSGLTYDIAAADFYPPPGVKPQGWGRGALGRLNLNLTGRQTRYDFHYDAVIGVRETTLGTWLVVDDHTGLALTPRAEPTSYLVRWPGAPKPAKAG